ncbi:hypothetical protein K2173_025971 [Erythroxylum novogranatense]|uniref:Secreted protein n=1 Tax=Erythroxylum novogranatense TaxID=1862640 RepID=A0AAV8SIP6_9ROSI|nr:hypothetical protein K2173_025971 [Erythroxylum novogranatense]
MLCFAWLLAFAFAFSLSSSVILYPFFSSLFYIISNLLLHQQERIQLLIRSSSLRRHVCAYTNWVAEVKTVLNLDFSGEFCAIDCCLLVHYTFHFPIANRWLSLARNSEAAIYYSLK